MLQKCFFAAAVALWSGVLYADSARVPEFSDYPAKSVYTGKAAGVILDTDEAKMFRTRLREGAKSPADFAGEHVLVLIGCGGDCLWGAAVSKRTGRVVFFPGSVCCWYGEGSKVLYERGSRLLITNGLINEGDVYATRYYEFTGREFKLIHTARRSAKADQEADTKKYVAGASSASRMRVRFERPYLDAE